MQLESLKMFRDVVETGTFTAAARRSHVTQSAVSQCVSSLEARYSARLLSRSTRRVTPTAAGERLARAVSDILTRLRDLDAEVRELPPAARQATVSTSYALGLRELRDLQRELRPSVSVVLRHRTPEQVYDDVLGGVADLGLVAWPVARGATEVIPLREDPLVAVLPPGHPLGGRGKVSLAALAAQPFIAFDAQTPTGAGIARLFIDRGLALRPAVQAHDVETVKRAVEVGLGVSVLPRPAVEHELAAGTLVARPLADGRWTRPVGLLVCRDRYRTRASQATLDAFLRAAHRPAEPLAAAPRRAPSPEENRMKPSLSIVRTCLMMTLVGIALVATSARAETDKKVERLFRSKCASCHGQDGKGQTEKGKKLKLPDMSSADFKAKKEDEMRKAITEGVKVEKDGIKKEMDSFKDELKPEQIDSLIEYVKAFK